MPRHTERSEVREPSPLLGAGEYAHRADLIEAGWSPAAIRAAVADEGLLRIGRQWVLRPDAKPELMRAAEGGGLVTCVTAAATQKLWVAASDDVPHIVLPTTASAAPDLGHAHAHWSRGEVPRIARTLYDRIENVLSIVADCQPYEIARQIWDSALRNETVTIEDLHAIPWRGRAAQRLCDETTALSHSGLETRFVVRMRRRGVPVRQQVKIAGHHVDALVGKRVVVQIDGYAHHSDARQRRSDIAHDRALQRLGYTVLRFDYHEIMFDWPRVEADVLRALAREA